MDGFLRKPARTLGVATLLAGLIAAGSAFGEDIKVKLSGKEEVPPVQSQGTGTGTIKVNEDKSVSGSITTTGLEGKAAHILQAAPGKNGPVAIPLEKKSDNEFTVPAGVKLTDAQYKALKAGELYVNVHTDAHKDGEIRGQLKP